MSQTKKCPRCGADPIITKEESFLNDETVWSIFHMCPKGFNVDEGPCISASDAVDAWNLRVDDNFTISPSEASSEALNG